MEFKVAWSVFSPINNWFLKLKKINIPSPIIKGIKVNNSTDLLILNWLYFALYYTKY
ncbi:MAG: hypothetical protein GW818_01290 [Flavobacteriales bacterium]|nr:hypothetical protein [Flavobacteriales bacterium]